jgi:hypothetical protein
MSQARFDQAFAQCIRRGEEKITPKTSFRFWLRLNGSERSGPLSCRRKSSKGSCRLSRHRTFPFTTWKVIKLISCNHSDAWRA